MVHVLACFTDIKTERPPHKWAQRLFFVGNKARAWTIHVGHAGRTSTIQKLNKHALGSIPNHVPDTTRSCSLSARHINALSAFCRMSNMKSVIQQYHRPCLDVCKGRANELAQIAVLVNEYKRFEDSERLAVTPTRQGRKRVGTVNNAPERPDAVPGVEGDQILGEDNENDAETSTEAVRPSTIHPPLSRAQKRAEKKKEKAEKSISKACKNQQRYVATIRGEDVERVAHAIHGDDYDVQRSLGNPLAIYKTNEDLESDTSDMPDVGAEEDIEDLVATVMANLGIHSAPSTVSPKAPLTSSFNTPGNGKRTKTMITQKLAAAIAEDVVNHRNELRQTQQRAAGFWRYANNEILMRLRERAKERSNEAAKD